MLALVLVLVSVIIIITHTHTNTHTQTHTHNGFSLGRLIHSGILSAIQERAPETQRTMGKRRHRHGAQRRQSSSTPAPPMWPQQTAFMMCHAPPAFYPQCWGGLPNVSSAFGSAQPPQTVGNASFVQSQSMVGDVAPAGASTPRASASGAPSSSSSSSESSSDSGAPVKYQKNDDALLTRSATYLGKLPVVRLQQLVEGACKELDPSATASASPSDLSRLLYMLTKLRPNVRTTSLRAKNYKQLKDRIKNAAARVAKASLPAITDLYPGGELDVAALQRMAAAAGFQQAWLEEVSCEQ